LPSEKAFRDWEAHANMPDFKTKYKEKLNREIENLGLLEFEEFPEELNEHSSFSKFSTNFYRRIMLENCGISDLGNLARNRRKLLELDSSREILDPVNIVRNYFIFSELLNVDLDTNLPSLAHLTHTSR
jgi:DNA integrity scanning protein DisA with diadenylate cyclase activity